MHEDGTDRARLGLRLITQGIRESSRRRRRAQRCFPEGFASHRVLRDKRVVRDVKHQLRVLEVFHLDLAIHAASVRGGYKRMLPDSILSFWTGKKKRSCCSSSNLYPCPPQAFVVWI